MSAPDVLVYANPRLLVAATTARLVTRLADVQAARGTASVVLTGGGVGIDLLAELRRTPARDAIDWHRLNVFWGDERFVPAGDDERNEKQAREALLDHVPLDPARVHPMPASDGRFDEPEDAARWYEEVLDRQALDDHRSERPAFDLVLLGVGEDGHVGSIFPESPTAQEADRTVVAVRHSPKPPRTRLTLTLPAIRSAAEVWLLTAGAGKSDAIALAHAGAGQAQLPAAGARGRMRTRWLLDAEAARGLGEFDRPRML